ncbi:MAG TPA: glycosyltransferase family 4 protein [Steroidobacteraceae bacterium]
MTIVAVSATLALVVAFAGTGLFRRHALRRGLLDHPTHRSSHELATPRGGGVAIVVAATLAFGMLRYYGFLDPGLLMALCGGIAVAAIGLLDDRHHVNPGIRLAIHAAAATWALYCLGGLPPLQLGSATVTFALGGYALGVIAIVWAVNLFNFMDGLDGIAGSEAIFVALGGAVISGLVGAQHPVWPAALIFAAACAGFLAWNWPPAKIFMGDVGSGYLGFILAVLAIGAGREHSAALWSWAILGGVFLVDATVTLLRRLMRRERVLEAHRSHAYQRLAQRWNSHRRVTLTVAALNASWLLPCALLAWLHPAAGVWIAAGALAALAIGACSIGAGERASN